MIVEAEHAALSARFRPMRTNTQLVLAGLLIAASGTAVAQAPPAPATPPQQTAPPSPQHSAGCAPADRPNRSPGGTMPVIPPPGSPGGDPNVRPK